MARAELAGLGRATIEAMVSSGKLMATRGHGEPLWRPTGARGSEAAWWLLGLDSRVVDFPPAPPARRRRRPARSHLAEVVPLLRPLRTVSRLEAARPAAELRPAPALPITGCTARGADRGLRARRARLRLRAGRRRRQASAGSPAAARARALQKRRGRRQTPMRASCVTMKAARAQNALSMKP